MYASNTIQEAVVSAIEKALGRALSDSERQVTTPPDKKMGDVAFGCFVIAKNDKEAPVEVAAEIAGKIKPNGLFTKFKATGPYVNFSIHSLVFQKEVAIINKEKDSYGKMVDGKKETIMVEFGQPNTHKAFHVGHLKSAISGLGIVRILENAGKEVIKTNYYGDVGMHVAKSTWGIKQKGIPDDFNSWDVHKRMLFIDEGYVLGSAEFEKNKIAAEEMKKINSDIYAGNKTEDTKLYEQIKEWSLEHLSAVFAELGVIYDKQYPESSVYQDALSIVKENKEKLFTESKGALIYDGEKEGLTTWVFLTQEGNPTYSAKDLALGVHKFKDYTLDKNITLTSVEQTDYFKVVIKCLESVAPETKDKYVHLPFGWLLSGNKKTSSRKGGTIKGMDVIGEAREIAKEKIAEIKRYSEADKERIAAVVANAGLKFMILSHEFHKNINYDPKKFITFEGFSGPYVLYAYVRAKALTRKVKRSFFGKSGALTHVSEIELVKKLSEYPDVARRAAENLSPNTICTYIHELASAFNAFYTNCPVKNEKKEIKNARVELTQATGIVLKNGLSLLGIETIEEM